MRKRGLNLYKIEIKSGEKPPITGCYVMTVRRNGGILAFRLGKPTTC